MINEVDMDLLKAPVVAVGHCANCFCTMGSGIAKHIRSTYPEVYESDCLTKSGDNLKLGTFSLGTIKNPKTVRFIYNLYGQYYYGVESRKLNYEAIYTSLEKMRDDCIKNNIFTIGFPKNMGCKLAGGHWPVVLEMIKHIYSDDRFTVYICNYA